MSKLLSHNYSAYIGRPTVVGLSFIWCLQQQSYYAYIYYTYDEAHCKGG